MSGIFISYRRNDSAGHAGRLYDRLASHFGAATVFMDVDAIRPGQDFTRVLNQRMASCDVLVAVIGNHWLQAQDEHGRRRLDDPDDYVRLEVATALARGITVVPVLVEGAQPPQGHALPEPLASLANLQALSIGDDRFQAETNDLIQTLERIVKERAGTSVDGSRRMRHRLAVLIAAVAVLGAAAAAWLVLHRDDPAAVAAALNGRWNADVKQGQEPTFRIVLDLQSMGDRLLGTVSYPTGVGTIKDGSIRGQRVSFSTVHTPQFEDHEAVTQFEGNLEGGQLQLVMQTSQTVRRFTATKQSP